MQQVPGLQRVPEVYIQTPIEDERECSIPQPRARRGLRLVDPQAPQEPVLERDESVKDLVCAKGDAHEQGGHQGVQEIMVCGRDNRRQEQRRVEKTQGGPGQLGDLALAHLAGLEAVPEDARVENEGAADGEGVGEVYRRHGGQAVDVLARHPHALGVVVADGVEEAVLVGQEARGGAGVEDEGEEGEEVGEVHGAAYGGESFEGRGGVVVPRNEADGARNVDLRVWSVHARIFSLPVGVVKTHLEHTPGSAR